MNQRPLEIAAVQASAERTGFNDHWRIRWQIENKSASPLEIYSGRLPHGKFKSPLRHYRPPLELLPQEMGEAAHDVQWREPPGSIVENAFLILDADWMDSEWRIFIRFTVTAKESGEPETATELITAQRVGFSDALA